MRRLWCSTALACATDIMHEIGDHSIDAGSGAGTGLAGFISGRIISGKLYLELKAVPGVE
jgi:hypothetical protein